MIALLLGCLVASGVWILLLLYLRHRARMDMARFAAAVETSTRGVHEAVSDITTRVVPACLTAAMDVEEVTARAVQEAKNLVDETTRSLNAALQEARVKQAVRDVMKEVVPHMQITGGKPIPATPSQPTLMPFPADPEATDLDDFYESAVPWESAGIRPIGDRLVVPQEK